MSDRTHQTTTTQPKVKGCGPGAIRINCKEVKALGVDVALRYFRCPCHLYPVSTASNNVLSFTLVMRLLQLKLVTVHLEIHTDELVALSGFVLT